MSNDKYKYNSRTLKKNVLRQQIFDEIDGLSKKKKTIVYQGA